MTYPSLQLTQVVFGSCLFLAAYLFLRRRHRSIWQAPFLLVAIGYVIANASSNILRYILYDRTALWVITLDAYTVGVVWWCTSVLVMVIVYIFAITRHVRYRRGPLAGILLHTKPEQSLLARTRKRYIIALILLGIAMILNPFSGGDYGVLSASSESDLSVGGLLVGGILLFIFSALALPLAIRNPILGWITVGLSLWMMSSSGSKGIGVVYLVFAGIYILRHRLYSNSYDRSLRLVLLLSVLTLFVPYVLLISNRTRAGDQSIDLRQSLSFTLARFTQQDVASVIVQGQAWREDFRWTYIEGNLLGFVPGFIYPRKPINPAYVINGLYGGPFTAASPSFFGALLIATSDWIYWPTLVIVSYLFGRLDQILCSKDRWGIYIHLEWYIYYTWAMFFEGVFVLWGVQLVVALIWRQVLLNLANNLSKTHRVPSTQPRTYPLPGR